MTRKRWLLAVTGIGLALIFLYGPGALRWVELKAQRNHLELEIAVLTNENQRLYEETRRLREDPAYAEAVARKEMGFVRPGETVVKFGDRKEVSRR